MGMDIVKSRKIIIIALAALLLLTVTAGVTLAWFQDRTEKLTNTLKFGGVSTEIEEEGNGDVKKSRIQNTGKLDCLVRARVTISPSEAATAINLTGKDSAWDWSQWNNGDGYVYYTKPLKEAEYTSYLFEGVALKEGTDWKSLGIETFDVTVYEESVQVKVHNGTEMISALNESGEYDAEKAAIVWQVYDTAVATQE